MDREIADLDLQGCLHIHWSDYLLIAILSIVLGVLSAWLVSYAQEKGKRYATREDFDALLTELRHTTRTTEEIKATILDDMWVRQRAWELKHTYFTTIVRSLPEVSRALREWGPAVLRQIEEKDPELEKIDQTEKEKSFDELARAHGERIVNMNALRHRPAPSWPPAP